MAIDVDWTGIATVPYRIYIPRADMPIVQVSPEIRSLDVAAFKQDLGTLQADEEGIMWTDTFIHVGETVLSGVTYARFVEIIAPYSVEFEDGQYTVIASGANHNIADVKVANQVSLVTQNSAGLINNSPPSAIADAVWDYVDSGDTGRTALSLLKGDADGRRNEQALTLLCAVLSGKYDVTTPSPGVSRLEFFKKDNTTRTNTGDVDSTGRYNITIDEGNL